VSERLRSKVVDLAIDGAGLYIGQKLAEYLRPHVVKQARQYSDAVVKILASMADIVVPRVGEMPYIGNWLELWGKDGVRDVIRNVVDKPPFCLADDASTIHCYNFDTTSVTVKIDGQAPSQAPTISGTADDFTIKLASPLSSGAHDLIVAGNRIAFSGKIYV